MGMASTPAAGKAVKGNKKNNQSAGIMGFGPQSFYDQFKKKAGKAQKSKIKKPSEVKAQVSKVQNKGIMGFGPQAQQQPVAKPAAPEAIATAQAAQGAQLQKDFKAANPNAPKMPGGIGIAGAPANQPQQFQQADDMPTGWAEKFKAMGPQQSQQPMSGGGRRKGGQSPTGSKGGQTRNPFVGGGGGMTPGTGINDGPKGPRPQSGPQPRPNMSRGGKGGQSPIGGGKGGRRPSPSMGRPNPAASLPANTLASRMADGSAGPSNPYAGLSGETRMTPGTGMQAPNVSAIPMPPGADENMAAPMMKKAPAFKMRSKTSTTFKEMGSSGVNKKSAPTRKTSTGYKMPGYGKR